MLMTPQEIQKKRVELENVITSIEISTEDKLQQLEDILNKIKEATDRSIVIYQLLITDFTPSLQAWVSQNQSEAESLSRMLVIWHEENKTQSTEDMTRFQTELEDQLTKSLHGYLPTNGGREAYDGMRSLPYSLGTSSIWALGGLVIGAWETYSPSSFGYVTNKGTSLDLSKEIVEVLSPVIMNNAFEPAGFVNEEGFSSLLSNNKFLNGGILHRLRSAYSHSQLNKDSKEIGTLKCVIYEAISKISNKGLQYKYMRAMINPELQLGKFMQIERRNLAANYQIYRHNASPASIALPKNYDKVTIFKSPGKIETGVLKNISANIKTAGDGCVRIFITNYSEVISASLKQTLEASLVSVSKQKSPTRTAPHSSNFSPAPQNGSSKNQTRYDLVSQEDQDKAQQAAVNKIL